LQSNFSTNLQICSKTAFLEIGTGFAMVLLRQAGRYHRGVLSPVIYSYWDKTEKRG